MYHFLWGFIYFFFRCYNVRQTFCILSISCEIQTPVVALLGHKGAPDTHSGLTMLLSAGIPEPLREQRRTAPPRAEQAKCSSEGPTVGAHRATEAKCLICGLSPCLAHPCLCLQSTISRWNGSFWHSGFAFTPLNLWCHSQVEEEFQKSPRWFLRGSSCHRNSNCPF